jgi:hypothetical protein
MQIGGIFIALQLVPSFSFLSLVMNSNEIRELASVGESGILRLCSILKLLQYIPDGSIVPFCMCPKPISVFLCKLHITDDLNGLVAHWRKKMPISTIASP